MTRYWSDSDGWIEGVSIWDGRDLSALRTSLCGEQAEPLYAQRVGYLVNQATGTKEAKKRYRDRRHRYITCACGGLMLHTSKECNHCRHQAFLEARREQPRLCPCGRPKGIRVSHCAECRSRQRKDAA